MPPPPPKRLRSTSPRGVAARSVSPSLVVLTRGVKYKKPAARPVLIVESEQPTYGCEVDPRHPEEPVESSGDWYKHYVEPSYKQRDLIMKSECGYDISEDPKWREFMSIFVHSESGTPTDDEWYSFECSLSDGEWWLDWSSGDNPDGREYLDLRLLYTFLLKHQLGVMETLIDLDYAHVGCRLFPRNRGYDDGKNFKAYSLLGIALFEAQSVEAVRMLLKRGADPNDKHAYADGSSWLHAPEEETGAELVVWFERQRGTGVDGWDAVPMIEALFEFGADATAASAYAFGWRTGIPSDVLAAIYAAVDAQRARAVQRWHNVLAVVHLISFWRRVAAAPDSLAARAAVARLQARM